jgi:hypothetical protein
MQALSLHFELGSLPELVRVEFKHPLLSGQINSVRGRTSGAFIGCQSFKWSVAVRALACLLVCVAERHVRGEATSSTPHLQGGRGSLASALDAALGKQPLWLLDMFGVASSGVPIALRLFNRSNIALRRPGPVSLSLNPKMLSPSEVHIFAGGNSITGHSRLLLLHQSLSGQPNNESTCEGELKKAVSISQD